MSSHHADAQGYGHPAPNWIKPYGDTLGDGRVQLSFTLPVALDPQGEVARAWGVKVFPTTVLIDPSGRARQRIRGEVDWSSPQALGWIDALLRR